jgi:bis(5'-nucleosyl)-tetraphosphatase (symmetrical)
MATYCIGDIQGCYDSLQLLLERIEYNPSEDRLWLVGDLVNRGPRSLEVLRWAREQGERVTAVLGNHDMHLLATADGARHRKKRDTFGDVLAAPDRDDLLSWLRARPFLHREGDTLMVHAGLHPSWSIETAEELAALCSEAMRENRWLEAWSRSRPHPPVYSPELEGDDLIACAFSILVGIRTIYDSGQLCLSFVGAPKKRPPETTPWFEARRDEGVIVFGHWAALGLHLSEHYLGIDTGCVWGNALTALRLEDRQVFRQPAVEG